MTFQCRQHRQVLNMNCCNTYTTFTVTSVVFYNTLQLLATGSKNCMNYADTMVILYYLTIRGYRYCVTTIAFHPSLPLFAITGLDVAIILYNEQNYKIQKNKHVNMKKKKITINYKLNMNHCF